MNASLEQAAMRNLKKKKENNPARSQEHTSSLLILERGNISRRLPRRRRRNRNVTPSAFLAFHTIVEFVADGVELDVRTDGQGPGLVIDFPEELGDAVGPDACWEDAGGVSVFFHVGRWGGPGGKGGGEMGEAIRT